MIKKGRRVRRKINGRTWMKKGENTKEKKYIRGKITNSTYKRITLNFSQGEEDK